jgi:hypothetical protein
MDALLVDPLPTEATLLFAARRRRIVATLQATRGRLTSPLGALLFTAAVMDALLVDALPQHPAVLFAARRRRRIVAAHQTLVKMSLGSRFTLLPTPAVAETLLKQPERLTTAPHLARYFPFSSADVGRVTRQVIRDRWRRGDQVSPARRHPEHRQGQQYTDHLHSSFKSS